MRRRLQVGRRSDSGDRHPGSRVRLRHASADRSRQRLGVGHAAARRHADDARPERHLQPRHRQRVLHGEQHAGADVHAAAVQLRRPDRRGDPAAGGARHRHHDPHDRQRRHHRRREDAHHSSAPGREVGHHPGPAGHRGRLRPRVQDAVQPGLPGRRARLLHGHDRRDGVVLRRVRQGAGHGRRDRVLRQLARPAGRGRDQRPDPHVPPAQLHARLPVHPDHGLLLGPAGRVHEATCPTAPRSGSTRSRTARTRSPRTWRASRSRSCATRPGRRRPTRSGTPTSTRSTSPRA